MSNDGGDHAGHDEFAVALERIFRFDHAILRGCIAKHDGFLG